MTITADITLATGLTNPGTDGDLDYPVTITDGTFEDAGGSEANYTTGDRTIEKDTLAADAGPFITAAELTTDAAGPGNFGAVTTRWRRPSARSRSVPATPGASPKPSSTAILGRAVDYRRRDRRHGAVSGSSSRSTYRHRWRPASPSARSSTAPSTPSSGRAGNGQQPNPTADPTLAP